MERGWEGRKRGRLQEEEEEKEDTTPHLVLETLSTKINVPGHEDHLEYEDHLKLRTFGGGRRGRNQG